MAIDWNQLFTQLTGTGNVEVSGGGAAEVGRANLLAPDQQELLSTLVGGIQNTPVGVDVAGASPLQQQGFQGLQSLGNKFFGNQEGATINRTPGGMTALGNPPTSPQGQVGGLAQPQDAASLAFDSFQQSGNVLSDLSQPFDPTSTTEFFNTAIRDPSLRTFEQDIIPLIQESFADQGANSGLNRSFERAGGNLASGLSAQLATLLFNTEQQSNVNRLNTLGPGQAFRQQPFDLASMLLGAGGQQRGIEQEQLNAQYIHPFERFLPLALQTQGTAPIVQATPFTTQNTGVF